MAGPKKRAGRKPKPMTEDYDRAAAKGIHESLKQASAKRKPVKKASTAKTRRKKGS